MAQTIAMIVVCIVLVVTVWLIIAEVNNRIGKNLMKKNQTMKNRIFRQNLYV